jgi:hypothetical protein
MDLHYNAFLNWLKTHSVTQQQFEAELVHSHTPIDSFVRKLHNILDDSGTTYQLWSSDYHFFNFGDSLLGSDFWRSVFPSQGLLKGLLTHYYIKPLTNEEIFTNFLKHCRKYSWIKDRLLPRELGAVPVRDPFSHIINYTWYEDTRGLVLRTKWYTLVDTFNLTGHVDISKIFK